MSIKLEVGKSYELNNGEIRTCTEMRGDNPLFVDRHGYGPFVLNEYGYFHQDGRHGAGGPSSLNVKRCVDDAPPSTPATPTIWADMTDAEKGALLLAWQQGKVIEWFTYDGGWCATNYDPSKWNDAAYRIKPEPKRETVELMADLKVIGTIDRLDGEYIADSIKIGGE